MCNRYRPANVVRIRDPFGFTYIESDTPMDDRYRTSGNGPLQPGPPSAGGSLWLGSGA